VSISLESIADLIRHHPRLVIADDFEIALQHSTSHSNRFQNGQACLRAQSDRLWVSLRILHRKRGGRAALLNPTREAIGQLVESAFESAQRSSVDPWFRFPIWKSLASETPLDLSPRAAQSQVEFLECDAALLDESYESTVTQTYLRRKTEKQIRQAAGRKETSRYSLFLSQAQPVFLREHHLGLGQDEGGARWMQALSQRAVSRLAQPAQTLMAGEYPVLLAPRVAAQWLEALAPWFYADRFQEGRSPLAEGAQGWSRALTLVDDGMHPASPYAAKFDLEGSPVQRTVLLGKGASQNLLHDVYSATRDNRLSTGNFHRAPTESHAGIRPSALHFEAGGDAPEELLAQVGEGVLLDQVERWEPVAGNPARVQVVASGFRVVAGALGEPLAQVQGEWDLAWLLQRTAAVADDLTFFTGGGSPSILIDRLPLSE